jgi:hypothetical protein
MCRSVQNRSLISWAFEIQAQRIYPTLLNGWVPWVDSSAPWYYKDSLGYVHIGGMVKNGSNGFPIMKLPAGYRPYYGGVESVSVTQTASGIVIGNIEVSPTGDVTPYSGGNVWVSLDNIPPFRAEQ